MNRIVFWDWTGTLVNESDFDSGVCSAMERMHAERKQISVKESESIFKKHLRSLEGTWQWHDYTLHGKFLGLDWKSAHEENRESILAFPKAIEVLEYAKKKGYSNCLATNAVRKCILLRIGFLGMDGLFDLIVSSDDVEALKQTGEHFRYGLEKLNAEPSDCLSIGNNPVQDIEPASQLGIKTVFCSYGKNATHYHTAHISHNHKVLQRADYSISGLSELMEIL